MLAASQEASLIEQRRGEDMASARRGDQGAEQSVERPGKLTTKAAREAFVAAVFARDKGCCVICGDAATSAHHILDRKLFSDGGYDVDNGASVCDPCHLLCETTEISCEEVRRAAGIEVTHLPPGFVPGKRFDKWGNTLLSGGLRVAGPLFEDDGCARALRNMRHGIVMPDFLPIPDWVGYHATSAEAWKDWRLTISELVAASSPGGSLEGWLFHGTSSIKGDSILAEGVAPTEVLRRDEDGQFFDRGSFWGTALTAAWYAEDEVHVRQAGKFDAMPLLIAAPVPHLESEGELIADEATFDFPDMVLLGMSADEFHRRLDELGASPKWREGLALTGAVAVIHSHAMNPACLLGIRSPSDAAALVEIGEIDRDVPGATP